MKHKVGFVLLIIGGTLMIISLTLGSIGVYEFIASLITNNIPTNLRWLILVVDIFINYILRWIANLGGVAIIIGAFFIIFGRVRFGKWLVNVGLAFGAITFIIWIITQVEPIRNSITDPTILANLDQIASVVEAKSWFQNSGVLIAIIGRIFVKKPKKAKEEEVEEVEEAETFKEEKEVDEKPPIPFQNIYCPNCGASLPFNAQFCSECGNQFKKESSV
jgi:hypothetical protein